METSSQLADRFRAVILNGKWIANTNYKDQLSDLSWEEATRKAAPLNSVAALCFHIHYYIEGIVDYFENGKLEIRDKYSFDMPTIDSKEKWDNLKNKLWLDSEKFARIVESFSDQKLEEVFVKEEYGNYRRSIEGVIEHSYYHLGQISLIKKLLSESNEDKLNP